MKRDLPTLDVASEDFAADPHRVLATLPAGTALARSSRGLEVLSYHACQEVFSSKSFTPCMPELGAVVGVTNRDVLSFVGEELNSHEGAEHRRLRSAVSGFFTATRLRRMREHAAEIATDVVSSAGRARRCDAVGEVGIPAAARFFCRLLGAPESDAEEVHRHSVAFSAILRGENQSEYREFRDGIDAYLLDLFDHRRAEPGDDFLSHLLCTEQDGRRSRAESLRLAITVLGASTEMVAGQIALLIDTLIEHPEQWTLLRERADLVSGAVQECARLRPTVFATERITREDAELCGVPVQRGEFVFVHIIAANRDPEVYREPDRLDITRPIGHPPLTWSVGRHFCVGRVPSVVIMEEVLRAIRARWTAMRHTAPPQTIGQPYSVRPLFMPIAVDQEPASRATEREASTQDRTYNDMWRPQWT